MNVANEISASLALTGFKPSVMATAVGRAFTTLLVSMNGNAYYEGSVLVPGAATALFLGAVTEPHYAVLYNNQPYYQLNIAPPANTTVSNAVNNGSGGVRITDTAHGYQTGDAVTIAGVGGTVEANGTWPITVIDANTFDLVGQTFTHTFTTNGTALLVPSIRLRNAAGGADFIQLFTGEVAVVPFQIGAVPYIIGNPINQLLEVLMFSY